MLPLFFYTAFVGMFISLFTSAVLVQHGRNIEDARTLSEIAASDDSKLHFFRWGIITSASLFTLTVIWFIAPRVKFGGLQEVAYLANFSSVVLLTLVPARGGRAKTIHTFFAYSMAVSMLASSFLFSVNTNGAYRTLEIVVGTFLVLSGLLTVLDRERFVWYELAFIHLSHTTVLIAALALTP